VLRSNDTCSCCCRLRMEEALALLPLQHTSAYLRGHTQQQQAQLGQTRRTLADQVVPGWHSCDRMSCHAKCACNCCLHADILQSQLADGICVFAVCHSQPCNHVHLHLQPVCMHTSMV
jgi:hypothetical protein